MLQELRRHCKWVLLGDFNVVEATADKSSQCGRLISSRERLLFNALIDALNILKPHSEMNGLYYTWNNLHLNGVRVLTRLNKCYLFISKPIQVILNYKINGDKTTFDHCPILVSLQLGLDLSRPSRWKRSTCYLKELKSRLWELWISQLAEAPFFSKLQKLFCFYREYCKQKAA